MILTLASHWVPYNHNNNRNLRNNLVDVGQCYVKMCRPVTLLLCAFLASCCYGYPKPVMYDTIVVGLGAAGTAAATTLAKAGKRVLVVEAQNRIGGRIYTVPFGQDSVELGAEWIHGSVGSSTYRIAIENNVTILPQDTDLNVYRSDGSSDKEDLVLELTNYTHQILEEIPTPEPDSIGHFISKRIREHIRDNYPYLQSDEDFISNFLDFLDFYTDTYYCSSSWYDLTTQSKYEILKGHQNLSWHKYGYKTLFEILLNVYRNGPGYPSLDIMLNQEVTQIKWSQNPRDNVAVTTRDGNTYTSNNVIVTPSVGVLKERYRTLFSPSLPDQKVRALREISMGLCNKLVFRFSYVWWPKNSFALWVWRDADKLSLSQDDQWLLKINTPGTPMSSNSTLTLWACGEAAITVETLPDKVVKTKVMALIRKFMGRGKTVPEPVHFVRTTWYSNPFTRGSYSYDNVNFHLHPDAREELAAPVLDSLGTPRVLFAGEATEPRYYATVHGALDTGFREANRLLGNMYHGLYKFWSSRPGIHSRQYYI